MALSYFPEFGGGFVESIVTSINGYFLVTVSENGCVYCFFLYSSGFPGLLVLGVLGGGWLNVESFFFLKLSLANDFFS